MLSPRVFQTGDQVVPLALWVVMRSPLMNWIGWLLAIPAAALIPRVYRARAEVSTA